MRYVSNAYKETMAQLIQPPTDLRLVVGVQDPTAESDATFSFPGGAPFSDTSALLEGQPVLSSYATFEQNFWRADGSMMILPEQEPYLYQGYVSQAVSGGDANFSTPPVLDITFQNQHDLYGLTFTFDTISGDHPARISVSAWNRDELIETFEASPNASMYVLQHPLSNCTHIQITFLAMNKPYRRLRLAALMLGVSIIFNTADIESYTQKWEIDPISTSLPNIELKFTVSNFDNQYNADRPDGIWSFLDEMQPINVYWGQTLDDGGIEWIDGGTYYTDGSPSTKGKYVTFTAKDYLSLMNSDYYKGMYYPNGISLYDLAVAVLEDANIPEVSDGKTPYTVAEELKSVTAYAPLPVLPHRECLQIIANAGRCVLRSDQYGRTELKYQVEPVMTVSANNEAPWSDIQKAASSQETVTVSYITFSPDTWLVDGGMQRIILPEQPPYEYQGYVTAVMTDENGQFATHPIINIHYSGDYTSYLFPITFDHINGIYATDFTLTFSNNGTQVAQYQITGNTDIYYQLDELVSDYTDLQMEFLALNKPNSRMQIENFGSSRASDYYLDFSVAGEEPPVQKQPPLSNVQMVFHEYTVDETQRTIYESELTVDGEETIEATYSSATNLSVEVENGTLVSSELYSNAAHLTIQGNGEVSFKITGNPLVISDTTVTIPRNERGEPCPFDNPLIATRAQATAVGNWVGDYLMMRNSYEMPFREDFRLEANDIIYMKSLFDDMFQARITKLEFNLPGQSGKIKLRRMK